MKKNKRRPVLLINPPNELNFSSKKSGFTYPPGGLLSLGACLEKENFPVRLLDFVAQTRDLDGLINEIKSFNPFCIGITSTSPQIRGATSLAKLIKKHFPEVLVCIGGPHPSAYYNKLKEIPYFDFIYIGEGEVTFPKILKDLEDKIPSGKTYVNKKFVKKLYFGEQFSDLDSIPFMARHLLRGEYKLLGVYEKFATIHTGRGCPFNCVFCSSPIEKRRAYRSRSVGNVLKEIDLCVNKLGAKFILFTDDTFTTDRGKVIRICQEIIKRKIRFKFCCETRVELVDEELIRIMKKAGLVELQFGVESGSERIRKEIIHKNFSQQQLENAYFLCRKFNIHSNAFIMMGFPTETKEDLWATHELCLKLPVDIIGIHFTVIMPGSDLYDIAIKEKKISPDYWNNYALGKIFRQPLYIPDGVSKEFMEKLRILTYKKFYFNFGFISRRMIYDIRNPKALWDDFKVGVKVLTQGKTGRGGKWGE